MKNLLLFAFLYFNTCFIFSAGAQVSGCTDPQSNNYNPAATINDGSCLYNATNLNLTTKTALSAPLLNETSGITYIGGKLWTFNDSGNANDIYRIDTSTSTVYQTVDISNATNVDWEDMASNNDHLFIGDFGNNNGNRQNLRIYRINIADLTTGATSASAAIINFSYSDQTSFPSLPTNNNFDCEAMIFLNDSIHLFSKNWVDLQTKHYVIPNVPGTHVAQLRETYNTGFLVTSASVQSFGVISLIGYLRTGSFPVSMVMLYDYKNHLLFNGNKRKFDVSTQLTYGQVEGVEFYNSSSAFVTNERYTNGTTTVTAQLRKFDLSSYLPASFLYSAPTADFTANDVTVCANVSITFTNQSVNSPVSYQWLFPGGTPSTSFLPNPQIQYQNSGTYSVTLIATNGAGSDTVVKTNYISVESIPSANISAAGSTTICQGSNVLLNANSGAGITYQWKNNGNDINGATASSYLTNAAGSFSCAVTNNCGTGLSNSILITVNTPPSAPAVPSGQPIVCKNTLNNLFSVSPVNGASTYTWSLPSGATIATGQGTNSISVDFSGTAISGNICVYASNACGAGVTTCKLISVVSAKPAKPSAITGAIVQCAGTTSVFSCPAVNNASSYNWTVPATATIVNGQGTNSITVNFLSTFISGSVKVAAVNCVGSSSFRILTVYGKPSTPGTISGPTTGVCPGTNNVSYSVVPLNAPSTYNWTAPANATIASGQGTPNITVNFNSSFSSGTLQVSASNICGSSSQRNATIRSIPLKPGTISGPPSICANQSGVTYSVTAVTGATIYNWIVPAGAVIISGQNSNSIMVNFGNAGGNVKVRAGNSCGNSAYRLLPVTVSCRDFYSQNENNFDAEIFPNPSGSTFKLSVNSDLLQQTTIIIRDVTGREIERYDNFKSFDEFEFGSTLPAGVYFAEIKIADEGKIMRILKQ